MGFRRTCRLMSVFQFLLKTFKRQQELLTLIVSETWKRIAPSSRIFARSSSCSRHQRDRLLISLPDRLPRRSAISLLLSLPKVHSRLNFWLYFCKNFASCLSLSSVMYCGG